VRRPVIRVVILWPTLTGFAIGRWQHGTQIILPIRDAPALTDPTRETAQLHSGTNLGATAEREPLAILSASRTLGRLQILARRDGTRHPKREAIALNAWVIVQYAYM
jgi:hypothetical protein